MAPLVLEGATLGKRHQHYNLLLKDAVTNAGQKPTKVDYTKEDIENLFNIDIAINYKNVEYVLDVLKGEDMLYATRVIKRSNWLINDDQFAHIINPEYLHKHLFPQMMPKVTSKLLLQIRVTLKNETRVEKFFQYYKEKDLKTALKWLPNCPLSVIEDTVKEHSREITPDLLRRLCVRSRSVLEIFVRAHKDYDVRLMTAALFILRRNPEKYLDAIEKCDTICIYPKFKRNHTQSVMKKCPQRIIDRFEHYMYNIDLETFAKCLKPENIKSFLVEQMEDKNVKSCFNQEKISIFVKYMPEEERYEFIKEFVDRKIDVQVDYEYVALQRSRKKSYRAPGCGGASNSSSYRWYKHAPFDVAFADLKKMIRSESDPEERTAMLMILVANACQNLAHILTLLQYYRDKHINEPFRFKVQFINDLLQKNRPHLFNTKIWAILDEVFRSMEVYVESENNVQTCIKAIIAYRVTRDEPVATIIEQKFNFDTMKSFINKMDDNKKEKLFQYLFNIFLNKLNKCKVSNKAELAEYVEILKQGLNLLNDWKKELKDHPIVISKIRECVQLKKNNGWDTSLTQLYNINKFWKKVVFEESLVLFPSPDVCMNVLKHDPSLLERNKCAVEALCRDDGAHMERVLGKLRVYWPRRAQDWAAAYRARLGQPGGHKALVRGLYSLLNQQELLDLLKKYEPQETKINWSEADELELSLRKNIAQNMHIARPQISPNTILWYAKGDYIQFTQPSLNAVLYNLSSSHSKEHVLNLLNGMTSLQKHGIRLAFAKMSSAEIKQTFLDVWKTNKNSSVRAALFQTTHELLCREQDEVLIADLWELMQVFIDSLTPDENKTIFNTMSKLSPVHSSIKAQYCMKSYNFLKTLPVKSDCKNVVQKLKNTINESIEEFDAEFIANIILEFDEVFLKKLYDDYANRYDMDTFISYLLFADNENIQLQRFEAVFLPFMEKAFSLWNNFDDTCYYVRHNFRYIVGRLLRDVTDVSFKNNKANPTIIFDKILEKLEKSLPVTQNYTLFRQFKLAFAFVDVLHKSKSNSEPVKDDLELKELHLKGSTDFSNIITRYLKEDCESYGTCIYTSFAEALDEVLRNFHVDKSVLIIYFYIWLSEKKNIPIHLIVIQLLYTYSYFNDDQKEDVSRIHEILRSHESTEVQIFYCKKFGDNRYY